MSTEAINIFSPDTRPMEIPKDIALQIGRGLVASGYRLLAGYTTSPDNPMAIRTMLNEMDGVTSYARTIHTPDGDKPTIVGPYYSRLADDEFCPNGLGIWRAP